MGARIQISLKLPDPDLTWRVANTAHWTLKKHVHTLKVPIDFLHASYEISRCYVFDQGQGYTLHIKYLGTKQCGKYVKQASNRPFN